MTKFLMISLLLGVCLGLGGGWYFNIGAPALEPSPVKAIAKIEPKPSRALGYLRRASDVVILLEDGRSVTPSEFTTNAKGEWRAVIDGNLEVQGVQP